MTDVGQMAIFIRGAGDNFNVTEELAALVGMKGATKGSDLLTALKSTLSRYKP
jgi:hypothetical protein